MAYSANEEEKFVHRILVEIPERKGPFQKPWSKFENIIKMYLKKKCWRVKDQNQIFHWWAVVNTAMNH